MNKKMKFLEAFTLSEILIALTVIGIVAALLIPALVKNQNEKAWNTAKSTFEKKLEVALKQMNTEEKLSGYSSTLDFVDELKRYIKITKICDYNEITNCFSKEVYWGESGEPVDMSKITNAADFGQSDWKTKTAAVQFANGVSALIAYNPNVVQDPYNNQYAATQNAMAILYDVSGYKNPNKNGKDIGSVNVNSLKHECFVEYNGLCLGKPFYPQPVTYAECQAMFESGKYGIEKGCRAEDDYWAGAVKTCGGTQNMPTFAEWYSVKYNRDAYSKIASIASTLTPYGFIGTLIWLGDDHNSDVYGNCGLFKPDTGSYSCYHSSWLGIGVCKE